MLNSYLPQLEMVARRASKHQQNAARLVSQGHRINSIHRGAEGAALLSSKQRQKELRAAWQLASTAWPHEPRLKALGHEATRAISAPGR